MTLRELIAADPSLLDAPVLGELQRTADGCIPGIGSRMCYWRGGQLLWVGILPEDVRDCYSSTEAAERAAGAKGPR